MLREQETETQVIDVQVPSCSAAAAAAASSSSHPVSDSSQASVVVDRPTEIRERWRRRLGSDFDVVTVELVADNSEDRLGMSLQGLSSPLSSHSS